MKKKYFIFFYMICWQVSAQVSQEFVFSNQQASTVLKEGQEVSFTVKASTNTPVSIYLLDADRHLNIQFDTLGHFSWTPSFDLVDRVSKTKEFSVKFEALLENGQRLSMPFAFTVMHVNRPPIVEELPTLYVKQSSLNSYQLPVDYAYDPDGDPLVFKAIPENMPEGSSLSSSGLFLWKPSKSQFYSLKASPLTVEFVAQDQPEKTEVVGKIRIQQTQQDLPPEILIVPGDTSITIPEDATLNLKLYFSDPNGDDNVRSVGFISSDSRIPQKCLTQNTLLQHEFTWTPGYDFVEEVQKNLTSEVTFFALDKENNKIQKKLTIKVLDAENMVLKDEQQYQKYRSNLLAATLLLNQLDENQKKLNNDYKKAKKGKKHRSILNASLGAATGLSPITLATDKAKVVSGIGGTTVLTLGTLEATEVIGKSKDDILNKIKININLRNKIQSIGDEFARRYALKSSRRSAEFDKDISKVRASLNDQELVLLELDAYNRNNTVKIGNKEIKKAFADFNEE